MLGVTGAVSWNSVVLSVVLLIVPLAVTSRRPTPVAFSAPVKGAETVALTEALLERSKLSASKLVGRTTVVVASDFARNTSVSTPPPPSTTPLTPVSLPFWKRERSAVRVSAPLENNSDPFRVPSLSV